MPPVARYPSAPSKYSVSQLAGQERSPGLVAHGFRRRRDSMPDAYPEYTRVGPAPAMSEASSSSADSIRDEIKASRNYVDPWDLENYVYLKRQCSDGSSDPVISLSTAGDVDSTNSDFYYVSKAAMKPSAEKRHSEPRPRRTSRSMVEIEEEMSLYEGPYDISMEIDKLFLDERARRPRRQSLVYSHAFPQDRLELFQNGGYECEYVQNPYPPAEYRHLDYPAVPSPVGGPRPYWHPLPPPLQAADSSPPLYIYQKSKMNKANLPHPRPRRISHSSSLSSSDDYCSSSDAATATPISLPEARIGMSTFGHMKIDYSWNWNNLDRYIAQY